MLQWYLDDLMRSVESSEKKIVLLVRYRCAVWLLRKSYRNQLPMLVFNVLKNGVGNNILNFLNEDFIF
jgi:hypothetical protein